MKAAKEPPPCVWEPSGNAAEKPGPAGKPKNTEVPCGWEAIQTGATFNFNFLLFVFRVQGSEAASSTRTCIGAGRLLIAEEENQLTQFGAG